MLIRSKSVALLALVPTLAIAAPKGKPKRPVRKAAKSTVTEPPPPAPNPPTTAADTKDNDAKDTPPEPAPAIAPSSPGAGAGSLGSASSASEGGAASASSDSADSTARSAGEPEEPGGDAQDVDHLRQEYLSLRDELFRSRARANAVASQLYSTRIQIKLTYTTGRYYHPAKSSIRLDGASVYEDATGAIAGDDGVRFDGYVAPGRHLITFRVEATGKDDDAFMSTTESQIVVKAVAGKDLVVAARARDSGDIAYEWQRSERGSYGLGIDVSVKTAKPAAPTAKGAGQ